MTTSGELELAKLIDKYIDLGIVKGGELLLPPEKALLFLEELEGLGVGLLGLDGWFYVDRAHRTIAQDLDVDLSIDEVILADKDSVRRSIEIVRSHIISRLPPRTVFVSLILDVPSLGKGI